MAKTVVDVLNAVAVLIAKPEAWRQGNYAGKRIGETNGPNGTWGVVSDTNIYDPQASCFCLLGAIDRVVGVAHDDLGLEARAEIRKTLRLKEQLHAWNDNPMRTHDDVLSAVYGTIERLTA